MARMNGGQIIVDYLVQERVPYLFGLCGHGNISLIDAFYERADEITPLSVHHETVAGFMADVYYRVSGRPVATFTSCGPGSANLPICLGNSFLDSVPFLAVTGNVPTSQFNRGAYNPDFAAMARSAEVEGVRVEKAGELGDAIRHAIAAGKPYLIDANIAADLNPGGAGVWELPGLGHRPPAFGGRHGSPM